MKLKETIQKNRKKLLVGLGILVCTTIVASVAVGMSTNQQSAKTTDTSKVKKKDTRKSNLPKETKKKGKKKDIGKETLDKYGVKPNISSRSSSGFSTSMFTPQELKAVANVINQQKEEKTNVGNDSLVPPVLPPKPTEPEKPVIPPVEPPIVLPSTPTINYQVGIIVTKNSVFDPYAYVTVYDEQDPNVSVYVDTTGINMSEIGDQSFVVIATNKFGKSSVVRVPIYVASKPVISAPEAIQLVIGLPFNPLSVVQATDEMDGVITDNVKVLSSTINTEVEESYSIEYSVVNSKGIQTILTVPVHVVNEPPTILAPAVVHEINQVFDPIFGVTATSYNGTPIQVTEDNVLENTVDITKEGQYKVVYQVKDQFGKQSEKVERSVTVENAAPEIHGVKDISVHVGKPITEVDLLQGVKATDREDDRLGLTLEVTFNQEQFLAIDTNVPGVYPLTYSVVDSMGKQTTKTIQVKVINDLPVIHGTEEKELFLNDLFNPLEGISVTDTEDGNIPLNNVQVTNTVNTSVVGTYDVVYKVTDQHGGITVVTRKIVVKAIPVVEVKKAVGILDAAKENTTQTITEEEKIVPLNPLLEGISENLLPEQVIGSKK